METPSSSPSCEVLNVSPLQILSEPEGLPLPVYLSRVQAGFPSPADDFLDNPLDLNDYLISNPEATFLVRATGDSMINVGICDQAILVVDRSINPTDGKIVIAAINGELLVKRLKIKNNRMILLSENPKYKEIVVNPESQVTIWGVVIHAINSFK